MVTGLFQLYSSSSQCSQTGQHLVDKLCSDPAKVNEKYLSFILSSFSLSLPLGVNRPLYVYLLPNSLSLSVNEP